jgi:flagellin
MKSSADVLKAVQDAITLVSALRSKLGAFQNRLESAMTGAALQQENQQESESRIRDVDMAEEMVKYSRSQILEQAAQTMLSQANQSPEGILKLLS